MSELDKILEGLVRRTTDGNLTWSRSVDPNEFVTAVDAIAIVIRERGGSLLMPPHRQLRIIDEKETTVEVLETGGNLLDASSGRRATDEQAKQLLRLFTLARRSALNTEATLEKLAKALEA